MSARYPTFLVVLGGLFSAVLLYSGVSSIPPKHIDANGPVAVHMTTAGPALSWNIQFPAPVLMDVQNSVNYQLNGSAADVQWKALMPSGDGIVRLGPDQKPFMLSTFHQLRCLDILRDSYVRDMQQGRPNPTPLTRHCLNYIRQMVLCRGNLKLERVVDPYGAHSVQIRDPMTCRDWRSLYSHVEANAASTV
ncbi:hypothetical protein BKA70DRAFT_1422000 [Coprinopsis sp. MPI-PUGE-AT-0042]|nr:hypothetical protein BKA70DRAFT_1422000 [Coprinopsis sp. MPI-PUGE-AT-0042]